MNLSKEMFIALKLSIQKWEDIYAGTGVDLGALNCPLCTLYSGSGNIPYHVSVFIADCAECPICQDAKARGCDNTPYQKWVPYTGGKKGRKVFDEKSKQLALDELNYLRGLKRRLQDIKAREDGA